ncbi:MAG: DUF3021 domain-containing protein [Oscillospiraceae bacterium]|nr:DUF3021 domain-containing protein [Oscillospiraceae bacterium]
MKKHLIDFLRRGLCACGIGPLVLAIVYLCLHATGTATDISTAVAAKNILTITLMAFIAAGITVVYQIEELPLFPALLLHGVVLYLDYLMIYLCNGWLAQGRTPLLAFTVIFVVGYALVWVVIYLVNKAKTKKLNQSINS